MSHTYRQISARHYDAAYSGKEDLHDLPFYVELAGRSGGPVLELACGTGRILLPTARAGIEIDGVDLSAPMLDVLRQQLPSEPPEVRRRVRLFEGDMRTFRSDRRYALVTIPFRPMQHMFTLEDQLAALKTAAFHLQPNGRLAFDVFYPKFSFIDAATSPAVGQGEEQLEMEWTPKDDPGTVVRRYFRRQALDKINQTFSLTYIFRSYRDGKLTLEESEPLAMAYYTYPHLRALFLLAGLEVVEQYGSFDRQPLDNQAREMIFVLKKAG
jgi:SAM-dependent methyltransferase